MVTHPQYEGAPGIRKNIAVVRLKEQLVFGESIQPINLHKFHPMDDEDLTISGWGRTSQNGPFSEKLKFAQMKSVNLKTCSEYVNVLHQHFYDVPATMCIARPKRPKGVGMCAVSQIFYRFLECRLIMNFSTA